ncbi:hypothetical protein [Nocardia sp. NPDC006630]|uniref:hypothetical protein n=1 Tax=Nocardia sp. NPDC006630 TaxID=3157181 RepID=UPI00339F13C1
MVPFYRNKKSEVQEIKDAWTRRRENDKRTKQEKNKDVKEAGRFASLNILISQHDSPFPTYVAAVE